TFRVYGAVRVSHSFPTRRSSDLDRLRRVGGNLEQESVRVPEHRLAAEGREPVERLRRLGSALHDVAEADDLLHAEPLDVGEHGRSEEHTSELQSLAYLVCRLLLE